MIFPLTLWMWLARLAVWFRTLGTEHNQVSFSFFPCFFSRKQMILLNILRVILGVTYRVETVETSENENIKRKEHYFERLKIW